MLGKFRKDDDGHWYFIPKDDVGKFDSLTMSIEKEHYETDDWYDLVEDFNDRYSKYRCQPPQSYEVDVKI